MLSYFRDYKTGQVLGTTNWGKRDYKQWQLKGFKIEAKRLKIGVEISNRGKRDYNLVQEFQIGAGSTNRCRTKDTLMQI